MQELLRIFKQHPNKKLILSYLILADKTLRLPMLLFDFPFRDFSVTLL